MTGNINRTTLLFSSAALLTLSAVAALPRIYHGDSTNLNHVKPLAPKAAATATDASAGVKLVGANLNNGTLKRGIYCFNAVTSPSFTELYAEVEINGGGVYANGKYYGHTYDYDRNANLTMSKWLRFDPEVWSLEAEVDCPLNDYTYIAFDRTFDASTGRTYALSSDRTGATSELSITDLATGKNTLIGNFDSNINMICIASDGKGKLYTLDTYGKLYSVDPATAKATLIGDTAIMADYITDYSQSMTYDPESGMLYWTEFHTEGFSFTPKSAIYRIDPATAASEKIADLPDRAEFTGIFVPDQGIADAPAAPAALKAVPSAPGSKSVKFSFTAPTHSNSGTMLTDKALSMEIIVDSETIDFVDDVAPGASVTTDLYDFDRGLHTVKVRAENGAGIGMNAAIRFFAGYDVPASPKSLTQKASGNKVTLTWEAPYTGNEGGVVRAPITYTVTRMPEEKTVATSLSATAFSETLAAPGWYYYSVTANSPEGEGPAAVSQGEAVGEFNVPYTESFADEYAAKLYTVQDINNDTRTWEYFAQEGCMRYAYSVSNPADDAIYTPAISAKASKSYRLSFTLRKYLAGYNEIVEVYAGDTRDISKMTLLGTVSNEMTIDPTEFSYIAAPKADGPIYFAFHAISPKNQMFIYLDDITVTENGSSAVPAQVDGLHAATSGTDRRDITIEFTAPQLTLAGSPLSDLQRVDIYRGASAVPVKSFENPAPGSKLTYTDASMPVGSYEYKVISVNAVGESQPACISVFAGIDTPTAPADLKYTINDSKITVSWTAPKRGVAGGDLDGLLSYQLVRMVNMSENARIDLDGTVTSYEDDYDVDTQAYLYYALIARTSAGESEPAYSSGMTIGRPYDAPWAESFAGAVPQTNPWFVAPVSGSGNGWSIVSKSSNMDAKITPVGDDGGMAEFDGYHIWADVSRLVSPRIAISHLANPKLKFSFFHFRGDSWSGEVGPDYVKEKMQVEIALDGGEFIEIPGALYSLYAAQNGWEEIEIPLNDYRNCEYVNIAFKGISGKTYNMYLDNIQITAKYKNNVAVGNIEVPESAEAGRRTSVKAQILNVGTVAAQGITAAVMCGGNKVGECDVPEIAARQNVTVEIPAMMPVAQEARVSVSISMKDDENSLDNKSREYTITLTPNALPRVEDLSAIADQDNVTITWSRPAGALHPDDAPEGSELAHRGYRVHCNGAMIADATMVEGEAFTHSGLENGTYVYTVTTLYDGGESMHSNEATATVFVSSVSATSIGSVRIKKCAEGIRYDGLAPGGILHVYAADGIIAVTATEPEGIIPLHKGSYVVSVTGSEKAVKIQF